MWASQIHTYFVSLPGTTWTIFCLF
jgi:hypothetical protein